MSSSRRIRVATCQLDTVVGDLDGNVAAVLAALDDAEARGCDLAVFPELTLTGYPPEDLLLRPAFVEANLAALERVAAAAQRCVAVIGFVDGGEALGNAAAICADGRVHGVVRKQLLPNYGPFDEHRYFAPGAVDQPLFSIAGVPVGVTICEDAWAPAGPIARAAGGGAHVVLVLNASPFHRGKAADRERMIATRAADAGAAIVYANLVGGQDELIFDGGSFVVDAEGALVARSPQFRACVDVAELEIRPVYRKRLVDPRHGPDVAPLPVVPVTDAVGDRPAAAGPANVVVAPLDPVAEVYEALALATRDYVRKNGFTDVVIGLSGGVDSSLVAAIAADALGAAHVHGVLMPSRYSSDHSVADAVALAAALGIDARTVPIDDAHRAFESMLAPSFADLPADLTEENLQSRLRGVTLMALSNKFGWLVLTTSNKSESAVGYATLYGDTAGAFSVIKDVPKLLVYELCRWRNARDGVTVVPESVLIKPPSAELRPDQRDDQSLPPYEVLDPIIEGFVDEDRSIDELVAAGFDRAVVERIARLVVLAEYKRRQTAPGARISTKAFGKDRRLPITNRYRG